MDVTIFMVRTSFVFPNVDRSSDIDSLSLFLPYFFLSFIVNVNIGHKQFERYTVFIASHILWLHHNFIGTIIIVRP